jgi:hypothetical protein
MREHGHPVMVHVGQGLQRKLDADVPRHEDEGPTGPERPVKGRETGSGCRNGAVQPPVEQILVSGEGIVEGREQHALGGGPGIQVRRHHGGVVLDGQS